MSIYGYMINAAKDSKYNSDHWFRYLRKVITKDKIKLSNKDIEQLMNSNDLTMYQKVTLQRAVEIGTPTYQRVINLNEKAKLKHIEILKKRIEKGEI